MTFEEWLKSGGYPVKVIEGENWEVWHKCGAVLTEKDFLSEHGCLKCKCGKYLFIMKTYSERYGRDIVEFKQTDNPLDYPAIHYVQSLNI